MALAFLNIQRDRQDLWALSLLVMSMFIPSFFFKTSITALFVIYSVLSKGSGLQLRKLISNPIPIIILFYPLMHFVDFVHIYNVVMGMKNIEIRASLFVLPFFIWLMNPSSKTIGKILLLFATSTLLFALAGLGYRLYFYLYEVQDTGYFYNDNIVDLFGFQAVYYAFYVNISIFIFLHHLITKHNQLPIFKKVIGIAAIVVLFGINYMLASRLSMLSLYAMLAVTLLLFILKTKRYVLGGSLAVGGIVILIGLFTLFPKTLKRFESIQTTSFTFNTDSEYNHFNGEIREENWNGLNSRMAIWSCATDLIKENPWFGVGHGDYEDQLIEVYKRKDFKLGIKRRFGTHNMYLQNLIMFGVVGFGIFLIYLFVPLFYSFKKKNYLFASIFIFMMLAMLTEDVLAKNQGVMPFALFVGLWMVMHFKVPTKPSSQIS